MQIGSGMKPGLSLARASLSGERANLTSMEYKMCIQGNDDPYSGLVTQVRTIIDLDRPGVELLKTDCSKYGVTNYPKCHVHDILILHIDGNLFYAKGEDVYLQISSRHSLNYKSFLEFSLSLFQFDECSIPERKFCFLDEPEVAEVNFERAVIQQQLPAMEKITDDTPPGSIDDPGLRALFIFYLSRKEKLVEKDGAVYDDVFNHHGRDIIHEVLASAFGQLLGVPVPLNYFGYKRLQFNLAVTDAKHHGAPDHHRYVLSRAVGDEHPTPFLVDVLNKKFSELNITWGLSLYREESNPLNLRFYQSGNTGDSQSLGDLIIAQCSRHSDLILSDFLDRLFGGAKDRKAYDYLLPHGLQGPIFTVDFGEILFPELMFEAGDPHYLAKKGARAAALRDYFGQISELAADNLYRQTISVLLQKARTIDWRVIGRLVDAVPKSFLLDHFDSGQYCYQKATIIDFLENQFAIIMQQDDI